MRKGNFVAKIRSFHSLFRKNATSPPLSICRHDGFPRLLIEASCMIIHLAMPIRLGSNVGGFADLKSSALHTILTAHDHPTHTCTYETNAAVQQMLTRHHDYSSGENCLCGSLNVYDGNRILASPWANSKRFGSSESP